MVNLQLCVSIWKAQRIIYMYNFLWLYDLQLPVTIQAVTIETRVKWRPLDPFYYSNNLSLLP